MPYRTRAALAAACSALTAALAADGPSSGDVRLRVGPDLLVSRDGDHPHVELHLAADPREPRRLLGGAISLDPFAGRCRPYLSHDGGWTWSSPTLPGQLGDCADPQAAFTPRGTALFVELPTGEADGKTVAPLNVWRSTDGGRTWAAPLDLGQYFDHPLLAVDATGGARDGTVYVAAMGGRDYALSLFARPTTAAASPGRSASPRVPRGAAGDSTSARRCPSPTARSSFPTSTFRSSERRSAARAGSGRWCRATAARRSARRRRSARWCRRVPDPTSRRGSPPSPPSPPAASGSTQPGPTTAPARRACSSPSPPTAAPPGAPRVRSLPRRPARRSSSRRSPWMPKARSPRSGSTPATIRPAPPITPTPSSRATAAPASCRRCASPPPPPSRSAAATPPSHRPLGATAAARSASASSPPPAASSRAATTSASPPPRPVSSMPSGRTRATAPSRSGRHASGWRRRRKARRKPPRRRSSTSPPTSTSSSTRRASTRRGASWRCRCACATARRGRSGRRWSSS